MSEKSIFKTFRQFYHFRFSEKNDLIMDLSAGSVGYTLSYSQNKDMLRKIKILVRKITENILGQ